MYNYNLTGQQFTRLLVINQAPTKNKRAYWNCRCKCGNECIAMGKSLRNGDSKSCGCLKMERIKTIAKKLPAGDAAFNQIFINYKRQASLRNLEFILSRKQFQKLTKNICYYCGQPPNQIHQGGPTKRLNGPYIYNGVDRLDNEIGYTPENSVSCCGICNFMKKKLSELDFISACGAVTKYQKKRAEDLLRLSLPKILTS